VKETLFIFLFLNPLGIVSKGASMMIAWNLCLVPVGAPRLTFVVACLVSLFVGKTLVNATGRIEETKEDTCAVLFFKCLVVDLQRWTFVGMIYVVSLFL
jgi:hypothetical protein